MSTTKHRDAIMKAQGSIGQEWFAITAFPLFAGTFGPIASALNICALAQPWRCEYARGATQTDFKDIPDPAWLIGINAISLVFGVAANLAIMFVGGYLNDQSAKIGFYLVLVTIIGGGLASFILIALVVAASMHLQLPSPPDHAFTEAYYYAIMAAGVYFITSAFVVYTAYMLFETRKTREGRRELSQQFAGRHRSLKILTSLFVAYLLIGAAIFSRIEGWRYLDGVYWANVTVLTIGFGDFHPVTHLGKSLLIPWTIFGIVVLFLVIYCITQVVFERGKSVWEVRIRDQERLRRIRERDGEGSRRHKHSAHLRGSTSSEINNDTINSNNDRVAAEPESKKLSKKQRMASERAARERDFLIMRDILLKSSRRRIWYSMFLWLGFAIFLWFFGAVLFYICEREQNWSYFTSVYFTFISLLTIGYGDIILHSMAGKAVFVLWSIIVVPTLTMLISTATEAIGVPYLLGMQEWFKRRVLRMEAADGAKMDKKIS
ncbi:voltage-gated potassium channel [Acephala macrosclerotiorum]|nr:voltage-gated potassium channel [Acephala macrosclerotiorum]